MVPAADDDGLVHYNLLYYRYILPLLLPVYLPARLRFYMILLPHLSSGFTPVLAYLAAALPRFCTTDVRACTFRSAATYAIARHRCCGFTAPR